VYKGETFHKESILDVQTHTKETFEENIKNFKSRLKCRGYPTCVIKQQNTS